MQNDRATQNVIVLSDPLRQAFSFWLIPFHHLCLRILNYQCALRHLEAPMGTCKPLRKTAGVAWCFDLCLDPECVTDRVLYQPHFSSDFF